MQHELDELLEQPREEHPRESDRQRATELARHQVKRGAEQPAECAPDAEDRDADADLLVVGQNIEQILLQRDEYPAHVEELNRQGQQGDEQARARSESLRNASPEAGLARSVGHPQSCEERGHRKNEMGETQGVVDDLALTEHREDADEPREHRHPAEGDARHHGAVRRGPFAVLVAGCYDGERRHDGSSTIRMCNGHGLPRCRYALIPALALLCSRPRAPAGSGSLCREPFTQNALRPEDENHDQQGERD